jgi:OmpA-OmpF porin, OOP family
VNKPVLRFPTLLLLTALVTAAGPAMADLPKTLDKVDPNAPCFRWPAVDYDEDGVYDRIDYCPNTPKGCAVDQWGCTLDADGDGICDTFDQCPNTPKGEKADKNGCAKSQLVVSATAVTPPPPPPAPKPAPAPVPPPPPALANKPMSKDAETLAKGGIVRLYNTEFETNSTKLTPESEQALDGLGEALSRYPDLKFEVGGHSDTRGPADANRRLSQKRAEAVREYLLAHSTLKPENVTAKGYGESKPLTKERNAAELKANRRVELRLLNPEALPKNVKVENEQ